MGQKHRQPKLRLDRKKYYCTTIYKPDGKRTTISFGTTDDRTYGQVMTAFGKWVDLFEQYPWKVLSFDSPFEAVRELINPTNTYTIKEFLERYDLYAKQTLRKVTSNGEHPDQVFVKRVMTFLGHYEHWPVTDFGPDELFKVQQALLAHEYQTSDKVKPYTRRGINDTVNWIKRIWKWGLGRGIVTIQHVQALEEVKPLRMGEAPDKIKRNRVTQEEFQRVLDCLNRVVGDMLKIIWHTGMRPYEVCNMRPYDLLTDDPECWLYIPGRDTGPVGKHKTMRFDRVKAIPLTQKSQEILTPRMNGLDAKDYIFSPKDAVQESLQKKAASRKTALKWGNSPGTNVKEHPMIKPGVKYDHNTLRRACQRACVKADVEVFVPYDLRRTMATRTRATLNKEAAKVLLGHADTVTTEIYLLEEVQEMMKVAKALGG